MATSDTEKEAEAWYQQGLSAMAGAWSADHEREFRSGHEGAIAAFDKAIELKPDYFDAWYCKGVALATLDRYAEAVLANEQALRYRPKDPETLLHKAVALSRLGRYQEALAAYEEVLGLWPDDIEALFREAEALGKIGRHEEAVAVWQDVLRSRPDAEATVHCHHDNFPTWLSFHLVNARFLLGNALASLGRHDEAKAAYREGIRMAGLMLEGPLGPAGFADALRRFAEAREVYAEMLSSCPQDKYVWLRAGQAFSSAGRPAEALHAYETAIRLAPEDSRAWFGKAEALVQSGRREEAVEAYRQLLRFDASFLAAKSGLESLLDEAAGRRPPASGEA